MPVDAANFLTRPIMPQCRPDCRNACIVLRQGSSFRARVFVRSHLHESPQKLFRADSASRQWATGKNILTHIRGEFRICPGRRAFRSDPTAWEIQELATPGWGWCL
jgi:hypothetical protein